MAKKKKNDGKGQSNARDEWQKQWEAKQAQDKQIAELRAKHIEDLKRPLPAKQNAAWQSMNALGIKLLKAHNASTPGNTALFPSSIHPVVAMLHAGSGGNTAKQITDAFGLKKTKAFQTAYGAYLASMRANKDFTLDVFNKIWVKTGLNLLPDYIKVLQKYETDFASLDFNKREAAAAAINAWADKATRGLISQIVTPNVFNDLTRTVIGNAVYFKGQWIAPFDKQYTYDAPFTPDGEAQTTVKTMTKMGVPVRGFSIGDFSGIDLPMKGASVLLLLPNEGVALDQAIANAPEDLLEQIDQALVTSPDASLDIYLPKFKIETDAYDLIAPTSKAGVTDLFAPGVANLSGIMKEELYVSAFMHKAVIEVDEEGAVGAAVTVAVAGATCWRPPTEFRVNRSFLAIVRDRSKAPIAFAKVHKPVAGS